MLCTSGLITKTLLMDIKNVTLLILLNVELELPQRKDNRDSVGVRSRRRLTIDTFHLVSQIFPLTHAYKKRKKSTQTQKEKEKTWVSDIQLFKETK